MFSLVEHKKSFIASKPDQHQQNIGPHLDPKDLKQSISKKYPVGSNYIVKSWNVYRQNSYYRFCFM